MVFDNMTYGNPDKIKTESKYADIRSLGGNAAKAKFIPFPGEK
jgi:hypothetical protein